MYSHIDSPPLPPTLFTTLFTSITPLHECRICAARMSELALHKAWFVHMTVDGNLVEKDAELREELSQGWFPVGADCAKKIPLNFRKKFLKEDF